MLLSAEALGARELVRLAGKVTVAGWFSTGIANVHVKHRQARIAFLNCRRQVGICVAYEAVC